ncbi:MAG: alanine dehydrogenase [Acidobacteria bacterium]|nr:alanine dehydrogenase [Acidobacteriota bacterium]
MIRENDETDSRVALTPSVARHLVEQGHSVWVESGAGVRAKFRDEDYIRAGAQVAYSPPEVIHRSQLLVKISRPTVEQLEMCEPDSAVMAFYHLAVAGRAIATPLLGRSITAIGCEIIETADGRLPVLATASEIAGQMTISLAAQLLRSSYGGRGILLGGSPGAPPAHVVILGAGTAGMWAARTARAAGARVTVLDIDAEKLRRVMEHLPNVATDFAEPESIAAAVAAADVLIGAVLVAGAKTPHLVSEKMVKHMRPGAVIIDLSVDQGGCVETCRPTSISSPTFVHHGVVHYSVPNLTADLGRSTSTALAQAMLPYVERIAERGVDGALAISADLRRGVYTYRGYCVHPGIAEVWGVPGAELYELLEG